MKKHIGAINFFLVISACSNIWAADIVTHEKYSYEFRNGESKGKGLNQDFVYEIDADKNVLINRSDSSYEYQIISYAPQIVGFRVKPQGLELMAFRRDAGNYYIVTTTYILVDFGKKLKRGDSFLTLSYGTFEIIE